MLSIFKDLFSKWHGHNIQYCNWKGTAKIEEGLEGLSDADVLVSLGQKGLVESILVGCGFVKVNTQPYCKYSDIYDWIGNDARTGKLVHIHLHYRMIAGHPGIMEYSLPWSEQVLSSRVLLGDSVYTVNPNWELLIFLTRLGLEFPNKKIDKKRYRLTESALKEFNFIQTGCSDNDVSILFSDIYGEIGVELKEVAYKKELTKSDFVFLKRTFVTVFSNRVSNLLYTIRSQVKTFIHIYVEPRFDFCKSMYLKKYFDNGIVIAFMGQDGSGKSTVSKDINKWLSWKLEAKRFYLGSGEHFNPWEKRLGNRLALKSGGLVKAIRAILSFRQIKKISDYSCRNLKTAFKYRDKGGIALLDRYPQTQFAGINDGPKIRTSVLPKVKNSRFLSAIATWYAAREEKKLAEAVKLQPDIVFKLMLPPEESIRRKPKENYESVCRKHEIMKQLAFPQSKVYEIDATMPYEEELILIKNIIWKNILK